MNNQLDQTAFAFAGFAERIAFVGADDGFLVFDENGDGLIDAAYTDFAKVKLMLTNAEGSTSVVTLAEAGIRPVAAAGLRMAA